MTTNLFLTLIAIISVSNFSIGQAIGKNSNPYFKIVNIDSKGKYTSVPLLIEKKIDHDADYDSICSYDFDGNGTREELFYSIGTQSFARFLLVPNESRNAITLHDDFFDIPASEEGFWFYLADIFNDSTPEILIFSKIGETSFLKIINYSSKKQEYLEHTYALNPIPLSENLLIRNEKKILCPIGSQGLFDEERLIFEEESTLDIPSENGPNATPESVMRTVFKAAQTGETDVLHQLLPPINQTTGLMPCDGDCKGLCNPGNESMKSELKTNYITLENFRLYLSDAIIIETKILSENAAQVVFLFGPNLEINETMNLQKINGKWYLKSF